jgi:PAS domain S-box-containing protein
MSRWPELHVSTAYRDAEARRYLAVVVSVLAFLAISLLCTLSLDRGDGIAFLYVFPIALLALEFGAAVGLAAGAVSSLAWLVLADLIDIDPDWIDQVVRVTVLVGTGLLVGSVSRARHREVAISRAVLDSLHEPASVKDLEGRYILVNAALERALQLPAGAVVGQSSGYGQPPDVQERILEADRMVVATRAPVEFEVEGIFPGIGPMTTQTVKSPVFDAHGEVTAIVTVAHDITRRVEHERRMLRLADEARSEYERARADYAALMLHRIANPLTIIEGAGETLRTPFAEDAEHRNVLADLILEQVERLARLDVEPVATGLEERELEPAPVTDDPHLAATEHAMQIRRAAHVRLGDVRQGQDVPEA